jgi:hypothetical protein
MNFAARTRAFKRLRPVCARLEGTSRGVLAAPRRARRISFTLYNKEYIRSRNPAPSAAAPKPSSMSALKPPKPQAPYPASLCSLTGFVRELHA